MAKPDTGLTMEISSSLLHYGLSHYRQGKHMKINALEHQAGLHTLKVAHWNIEPQQHWTVFSSQSQCLAELVNILCGEVESAAISERPARIGCVSLAMQQQLLERELANDETDFQDHIDYGSSVEQLVMENVSSSQELEKLLAQTDLLTLRHRPFRQLSTGETRRVMLARALANEPELLILDEPYSGLDIAHRAALSALLNECAQIMQIIVVTSRDDEMPDCMTHVALFVQDQLEQTMEKAQFIEHPLMQQLQPLSSQQSEAIVDLVELQSDTQPVPDPLVEMNSVKVEYVDGLIFQDLDWQIKRGEHWQIRGPNGCGKSTLLGLIMGDHPQCYSNDIRVLGMKRGSGESIWDVKKRIGIVSSALHLQYRVGCSALDVVLSGFFDSIGLYEKPSTQQIQLARQWLSVLEMSELERVGFKSLGYGQQRLLLIARALIKQPALLILDEPYQGLDYLNRKLMFFALSRIASANLTQLLYVTHHQDDALDAVTNFVDFEPAEQGHRVIIRRT